LIRGICFTDGFTQLLKLCIICTLYLGYKREVLRLPTRPHLNPSPWEDLFVLTRSALTEIFSTSQDRKPKLLAGLQGGPFSRLPFEPFVLYSLLYRGSMLGHYVVVRKPKLHDLYYRNKRFALCYQ
jgi:hypothetical protein